MADTTFVAHQRRTALAGAAGCIVLAVVSIGVIAARHGTPAKPEDPAAAYVAAPAPSAAVPTAPPQRPAEATVPTTSGVPAVPSAAPAPLPPGPSRKPRVEKQKPPEPDRKPPPSGSVTFEPSEIPAMNSKAEKAAGDGDYDRAIQLYQLVLRYEAGNADAQRGLERAKRNKAARDKAAREQVPQ